jgi:AGZA family xanthine/uracil permease-like MFS transporter
MKILSLLGYNPKTMNVRTEMMAGLTTFLTMSYILAVNPDILSAAHMDKGAVFTATALASAVGTLIMAFLAKVPFALAPGMGINAFFAFTLVQSMGYTWEEALTAVFVEGIIFVLLTICNIREKIVNSVPETIRYAISGGIGLFITFIGLTKSGIIVSSESTYVSLGAWTPITILSFAGIILSAVLMKMHIRGALFYTILIMTIIGIPLGVTTMPEHFIPISVPHSLAPTFMKFDFSNILSFNMVVIIFTLVFMDLFDTLGTLIGAAGKLDLVRDRNEAKYLKPALLSDSLATVAGAIFGTSTVTTFVESTTGIAEGGRSGLTSAVTAVLFLVALFFSPVFLLIPSAATTCALVIVGVLMMESIRKIDFSDITESLPAFLTIIMMPLCYSIAEGIVMGMLSFVLVKVLTGQWRKISVTMYILAILFILHYVFR